MNHCVCVCVCVCGYCTLAAVQACHTRIGFSTDLTGYQMVFLWISLPEVKSNSNGNTKANVNYFVRWTARILIELSLLLWLHAHSYSYVLNTMANNWNASGKIHLYWLKKCLTKPITISVKGAPQNHSFNLQITLYVYYPEHQINTLELILMAGVMAFENSADFEKYLGTKHQRCDGTYCIS